MLEFWRHKKSIHQLLSPLSLVYQCGLQLDKYRKQNSVYVAPVPVVSVGNLVVGGTGKTPVVGALARYFAGQDIPVAVLSRGYGVKTPVPVKVLPDMQVHQTGDEPPRKKAQAVKPGPVNPPLRRSGGDNRCNNLGPFWAAPRLMRCLQL